MKKCKKSLALVLAIATVLMLCIGSLAYFTDRISGTVTAKAGTLELALSKFQVSQTANLRPGSGVSINFTLTNIGNKSADIQETLVLTSSKAMGSTTEFEIYAASDVTITNGVATVKAGASPLQVRSVSADGTQITYAIPEFVLNGTGTGAETESGVTSNAKASAYVLVFNSAAGNDFQNVTVTLDYMAQAKQHRNTDNSTWAVLKTQSVTFGNNATTVVPEK